MLFHGSPIKGLTVLTPHISEHGRSCVYLSANPVAAALYAVRPVGRPHSWYPYGFGKDGVPCYTEAYPHALADVYKGKRGYLYRCTPQCTLDSCPDVPFSYISKEPVSVQAAEELSDVLAWLLLREAEGAFRVTRFFQLNTQQRSAIEKMLEEEIQRYRLREQPDCSCSRFLRERFPTLWVRR